MKFGLFILSDYRDPSVSHQERFGQFLEQVDLAEALGFDSVWFAEHHFTEYGLVGNTLTMAAAAASRTERVRLGTGVVIVPFVHPLRLAEEAAMVDVLSHGRLDLGVGRGYQPGEFHAMGLRMEESQAIFDESMEVLEKALTAKPFTHHGARYHFDDVTVHPRPVQDPVPVWTAAASPSTFDRLGRQRRRLLTSPNFTPSHLAKAFNERYLNEYVHAGGDAAAVEIPMMKQVYVNRDPDKARSVPKKHSLAYFRLLGHLIAEDNVEHASYEMYSKTKRSLDTLDYETLLSDGVVFGAPEEVTDQLVAHWRDLHVNYFLCWADFGGLPHDEVLASINLLAHEVLPGVRARTQGISPATAQLIHQDG